MMNFTKIDRIDINKSFYKTFKKIKFIQLFTIIGCGVLGFLFYYFTSCCSDDMPLNLNPYITVLYGVITGVLISVKY